MPWRSRACGETNRGWVLGMGGEMLFETGKATLKPGAARALERVAQFMTEHPERDVSIEGFTDITGSEALNQQLSEERAHAVRQARRVEIAIAPEPAAEQAAAGR